METYRGLTYLQIPLRQWGYQGCLPLSVFQLEGEHCQKPHCRNGVVDKFGQSDTEADSHRREVEWFIEGAQ